MAVYLLQSQSLSDKDQKFLKEAAEGGIMEVKLGQLAVSKANSSEAKMLGQHMIDDHTKANFELMALAGKKNVSVPSEMGGEGQKKEKELSEKSGADFDKAYAKCMVKDHKKDVKKFKTASKKADDKEVRDFAAKTLPTLEHHLMMSKETCKTLKKK